MDVLVAVLLCVIIFLLYLLNENKNEVLKLKHERRDRENKTVDTSPQIQSPPLLQPPVYRGIFVSVIFNKGDQKSYEYLLGDNRNVKVGDFVEVYAKNKASGEVERHIVQVVYLSKSGEISRYAKSAILKKADYDKW